MEELLIVLILSELTALVYVVCMNGDFILDDLLIWQSVQYSMNKRKGTDLKSLFKQLKDVLSQRALLHWTFKRDALLHGWSTLGWHWTNNSVHIVNVVAMYAILRWWFDQYSSGVGALILAFHPLACQSVAYLSGRSSALCAMFYLLSILAFMLGWWLLIPVLAFLGFKCKEEIAVLPVTLFLVWRYM